MLDEIDKLGSDFRGDPSAALLEVLDPEQNGNFSDHFLSVPFDLSKVLFIATANMLDPIPAPLRDRMEVIQLAGYTPEEKFEIARSFLIPRQMRENGLQSSRIRWSSAAVRDVVTGYTHEAGVRNLERQLAAVCRKVARRAAGRRGGELLGHAPQPLGYLGSPRHATEGLPRSGDVGARTGWPGRRPEARCCASSRLSRVGGVWC